MKAFKFFAVNLKAMARDCKNSVNWLMHTHKDAVVFTVKARNIASATKRFKREHKGYEWTRVWCIEGHK